MRLDEARRALRPVWSMALTVAGASWTVYMLRSFPWHHFMAAWVVGVVVAGYGAVGLYREIRNRVIMAHWLSLVDPEEAAAGMEGARRAAARLPAWYWDLLAAKRERMEAERPRPTPRSGRRRKGEGAG